MTITSAPQSKTAFGRFVQTKRRDVGLTQRDLAALLFVTESAVSKWERGLSYPDMSLVISLAAALGVSEGELINASDNHQARIVETQAQTYRRWRGAVLWSTIIGYAAAALASLIVNLAVQHTLSWFWIVLAAVTTAFSLTTLPLLVNRTRGWIALGAFLTSLFGLLAVAQLLYGGDYVTVAVASILFAAIVLFVPFVRPWPSLPRQFARHRLVVILVVESLALLLLILVVLLKAGDAGSYFPVALPIAAFGLAFVWIGALLARYLPIPRLYRVAIIMVVVAVFAWVSGPVFDALASGKAVAFKRVDFSSWELPFIQGNVQLIIALACVAVALLLCATEIVQRVTRLDRPTQNLA